MKLGSLESFGSALNALDEVWAVVRILDWHGGDPSVPAQLPDISLEATAKRAAIGRSVLERIARIDVSVLPHDLPITLELARQVADRWAREEDWYWLVFDPLGIGFYGMFAPTAYCAGVLQSSLARTFSGHRFASPGDGDRYVGLVRDYGRLVRQMLDRTSGQFERGIVMPKPQLDQAVVLMRGLAAGTDAILTPGRARLSALDADDVLDRTAAAIIRDVAPAFDAFLTLLDSADYVAAAPESVGIAQYPGGAEVYEELVRLHTTLDLSPGQVHAIGLARMAEIQAQMRTLLDEIGFSGGPTDYIDHISADPRWRASGAKDIGHVFERYIDRIAPHIDPNFNFKPKSGHGVQPLPAALEASMTFGFYARPTTTESRGLYIFNSANLANAPLHDLGALTFHELVPGHHFHFATQEENENLHPLRRKAFINAFNEGWAEYAASFAGEIGLYPEPEERFGRLTTHAFLTCRLVVDTGMNALSWSLEEARDYMSKNAFMREPEIHSESIRYSCDIPGQSLAYKLGDTEMFEAREEMRATLGDRFDIRDFHDALLMPGALPLTLMRQAVREQTRRLAAEL